MRSIILIPFLSSLAIGSLMNDAEEPLKSLKVSDLLNKVLNDLEKDGFLIPEVDLGEDVGRFSNVSVSVPGEFLKKVDSIGNYGFKLNISAEYVNINGEYDIQNIELPNLFPIFGKGNFGIILQKLDLIFHVQSKYNFEKGKFDINIPKFNLSVNTTEVKFENLMNDPDLSDFLNELISSLVPDVIKLFHERAIDYLNIVIDYVMNKVIYCIKNEALTGKLKECLSNITKTSYDLPEYLHFSPTILKPLQ